MKLFYKNLLAFLLLIPTLSFANTGKRIGKHTKEKNIYKEFIVPKDIELRIHNSYGNIDISTSNNDKIEIKVQVIVNGDNETSVNSDLELININFNKLLKRKWLIIETNNIAGIKNHKEVHYQIKVPKSNPIWVSNFYGDITIDKIDNDIKMAVTYGNILANELNGSTVMNVSYSTRTTINYAEGIDLFTDFSDIIIKNTKGVFVGEMNSSNINIEKIETLIFQGIYGNLNVGQITKQLKVIGTNNVNMNFNKLSDQSKIDINSKYGTINIDHWSSKDTRIKSYGGRVTIGYNEKKSFNINLNLNRMDEFISIPMTTKNLYIPLKIKESLVKKTNNEFTGYHLKKKSERNLNINLSGGILRLENKN